MEIVEKEKKTKWATIYYHVGCMWQLIYGGTNAKNV